MWKRTTAGIVVALVLGLSGRHVQRGTYTTTVAGAIDETLPSANGSRRPRGPRWSAYALTGAKREAAEREAEARAPSKKATD